MSKLSNKTLLLPLITSSVTAIVGALTTMPLATADDNIAPIDDTITITVDSACTMGQTVLQSSNTLNPGETNTIGSSRIAAYCNDAEGYAIYAIGYTNGEYGNTGLVSTSNSSHIIPTGTSGTDSYWNMKLTGGTASGPVSYQPTMLNTFTTNTNIPNDYTKVAYRDSSTIPQTEDPTETGSYFTTAYQAHLSTTQPAGVYNGQVQYVMVHPSGAEAPKKPSLGNLTYMQDFADLSSQEKSDVIKYTNAEVTYTLIDKRDNTEYLVAKLADGNIWMTENLDIAGNTPLYSETSNVPLGYPASGGVPYYTLPTSSTSGFDDSSTAYVYNVPYSDTDRTNCNGNHPCYSYYSWLAATAMSGSNIASGNTDAPYSICPKGWKLPSSRNTVSSDSDFYRLTTAYGMNPSSTSDTTAATGANFYNNAGPGTIPNFLLAGYYSDNAFYKGDSDGRYWSATSSGSANALFLYFTASRVFSADSNNRKNGRPVRCMVE